MGVAGEAGCTQRLITASLVVSDNALSAHGAQGVGVQAGTAKLGSQLRASRSCHQGAAKLCSRREAQLGNHLLPTHVGDWQNSSPGGPSLPPGCR